MLCVTGRVTQLYANRKKTMRGRAKLIQCPEIPASVSSGLSINLSFSGSCKYTVDVIHLLAATFGSRVIHLAQECHVDMV